MTDYRYLYLSLMDSITEIRDEHQYEADRPNEYSDIGIANYQAAHAEAAQALTTLLTQLGDEG